MAASVTCQRQSLRTSVAYDAYPASCDFAWLGLLGETPAWLALVGGALCLVGGLFYPPAGCDNKP